MKNLTGLLCIAIIAVTGGLIGFTGYTTDAVETTTPEAITATATPEAVEKNPCGCCVKRNALQQERVQQARARKRAREHAADTPAP